MKNGLLWLLIAFHASPLLAAPDGADLYHQHCAACHGVDGKGGVGVPLALKSFLDDVSDRYLTRTIRLGRPGRVMPAFNHLSEQEVGAIVKHIRGWSDGAAPVYSERPIKGDIKQGKALFQARCSTCHGQDGMGGTGTGVTFSRPRDQSIVAPSLANPGFLASVEDHMIKQTLMHGRKGTPMSSFLEQGLTVKQLDDIVAYIRSLESVKPEGQEKAKKQPYYLEYELQDSMQAAIAAIKRSAVGANFRIIRQQYLDDAYVKKGEEDKQKVILYFCNFEMLNRALAIDPRVGLFLPCRVTLIQQGDTVKMLTVNPEAISYRFNNAELDRICKDMASLYREILEEASL